MDFYLILAPLILLTVVGLLRFVGCSGSRYIVGVVPEFLSVNCGGPLDYDAGVTYHQDDGEDPSHDWGGYVFFESDGGQPFKLTGATVTDGHGNPAATVYGTCRTGADFTYTFYLIPGNYRVFLRFAEIGQAQNVGDRVFSFTLDGGTTFGLPDGSNAAYDIIAKAGGPLITHDEQVDVSVSHGLKIHFLAGSGTFPNAMINAIEVAELQSVVVSPASVTLLAGQTQQFQTLTPAPQVTFEVTSPLADSAKGSITANGLYTAPGMFTPPIQETIVANGIAASGLPATGSAFATVYLPVDTKTQGKFLAIYGRDGFVLANTPQNDGTPPAYAQQFAVASLGGVGTLNVSVDGLAGDPRVLDPDGSGTRPAIMWDDVDGVHGLKFSFAFTDGQPHLFGIYCFDFDGEGRRQHFDMIQLDAGTTQSQDVTIGNGTYLFWIGSGRIEIHVTRVAGSPGLNNVVNGVFFR